jgi:hypothetical protein
MAIGMAQRNGRHRSVDSSPDRPHEARDFTPYRRPEECRSDFELAGTAKGSASWRDSSWLALLIVGALLAGCSSSPTTQRSTTTTTTRPSTESRVNLPRIPTSGAFGAGTGSLRTVVLAHGTGPRSLGVLSLRRDAPLYAQFSCLGKGSWAARHIVALGGCSGALGTDRTKASTGSISLSITTSRSVKWELWVAQPKPPPLQLELSLDQSTVKAGQPIKGYMRVTNNTGRRITVDGCLSWFSAGVENKRIPFHPVTPACLQRFTIGVGVSRYRVKLATTYQSCVPPAEATKTSPACLAGPRLPPLPAGIYKTKVVFPSNVPKGTRVGHSRAVTLLAPGSAG